MADLGLLILRLTLGTLLMGHGSQKLFGWFEGPGLKGAHGFMEKLGMRPGKFWGTTAAAGEFGGGLLTALGFLNPIGPLGIGAAMTVALRRAHWRTPIWASKGGGELPIINLAGSLALALSGPGRLSLDSMLGIRMPRWLAFMTWIGTIATVATALYRPEIVETALQKLPTASPAIAPTTAPAPEPDIAVENRISTQKADQPTPA